MKCGTGGGVWRGHGLSRRYRAVPRSTCDHLPSPTDTWDCDPRLNGAGRGRELAAETGVRGRGPK